MKWAVVLALTYICVDAEDKFQKEIDAMKAEVEKLKEAKAKKALSAKGGRKQGCDGDKLGQCKGYASWRREALHRDPHYVKFLRKHAAESHKDRPVSRRLLSGDL